MSYPGDITGEIYIAYVTNITCTLSYDILVNIKIFMKSFPIQFDPPLIRSFGKDRQTDTDPITFI